MTAAPTTWDRAARPRTPLYSVDALARENVETLATVYRGGTAPRLSLLDGTPRGRMLSWVGSLGRGRAHSALRRVASSRVFPWGGKSFQSKDEATGTGINRVILYGDAFPFATRFGPSVLDGEPCLILDYDQPENPWAIRQIHDELRQVSPGVFLGPAMWKSWPLPQLVLFFAIETRGA
jgi:hypothetical protein